MQQEIKVSEDDIAYAEKILLPPGKVFDAERRDFIRNMSTLDLQAVPGSGKTTALLAKLLIIERYLPFDDGSGILVISHTNAAIDEIKHKIQLHCPRLFNYPNFIGTIQSFVDEFLAIPICNMVLSHKIQWIDTERFESELWKLFKSIAWDNTYEQPTKWLYQRFIRRATAEAGGGSNLAKQICNKLIEDAVKGFYFDFITGEIKDRDDNVLLKTESNKKFQGLKKIILEVLGKGIISYKYAYHMADYYVYLYPGIIEIIRKRFPYVFIDEMQDMDTHQYSILEKLFHAEGNTKSVMQRIGDKNQAIYSTVKVSDIWIDRGIPLKISGSPRLSRPIAEIAKKFALFSGNGFEIVGLNECTLKPHILIFDDSTISHVLPTFAELVKQYRDSGQLTNQKHPVKVVCWNTEWKDEIVADTPTRLRLVNYYCGYRKNTAKVREDYPCLKSYLVLYDKTNFALGPIRKNILNALVKILFLEGVYSHGGKPYTIKKMLLYLKTYNEPAFQHLCQCLYEWALGLAKGELPIVWEQLKKYTENFFGYFSEKTLGVSKSFINADAIDVAISPSTSHTMQNIFVHDGVEMEIASVHSVKGQTHSATLYLESYYQGAYETDRLSQQFLGVPFNDERIHHKSATKMTYVGLTRATDLLCIGMHKDRFEAYLKDIDENFWAVRTVELN